MKGFAVYDFPFGVLCVGYEDECITSFDTIDEVPPGGQRTPLTDRAFAEVQAYLSGARRTFSFPYRLEGTAFEKSVWQALLRIPYGETRTYGDIAAAIGSPRTARAVGRACHENPLILVVPCHRVVAAGGRLGGYAGGLAMKEALLALEQGHRDAI